MTRSDSSAVASRWVTVALCALGAFVEGFDLQSSGIAAPGLRSAFHLGDAQLGIVFSASTLGLLPGALAGGWLADRVGRKAVLIASLMMFGLFSLGTALAWNYPTLILARFITGVGLGSAMPNLIALCSESVSHRFRQVAVAVMYAGMPLGGAVASVLAFGFGNVLGWRLIFQIGGASPLAIVPLLLAGLQDSRPRAAACPAAAGGTPLASSLFADGRASSTLMLWAGYFCTLIVLYLLQNWLPLIVGGRGFSRSDAALVQILFNLGGAVGSLGMGLTLDRNLGRIGLALIYGSLVFALVALGQLHSLAGMAACGALAGFGAIGGQMALYGFAPLVYDAAFRGTGVGAAVAVGRLGSIVGPLAAGQLLARGATSNAVLLAALPAVLVAGVAARALLAQLKNEWSPCS